MKGKPLQDETQKPDFNPLAGDTMKKTEVFCILFRDTPVKKSSLFLLGLEILKGEASPIFKHSP